MSIRAAVNAAIKEAMVAKDKDTLQTLRMVSAAFKQIEVDRRVEVSDEIALTELVRQVKQRQDAASQFRNAGREDLALQEDREIAVIQRFLPEAMSEADMQAHVDQLLENSELPREMKSMGSLMAQLKSELEGRADMAQVSKYLRSRLQG
ncbi:MAG: GatB/YqeY domain-containing protein [Cardiobacteriaceae bacterium]|nr:GatB/YqeY domain-containing protein [Cardiobacteriaceae bacterium]